MGTVAVCNFLRTCAFQPSGVGTMPDLPFINALPNAARSSRERQLELSRVRSYTATLAHRQRKARQFVISKVFNHPLRPLSPPGGCASRCHTPLSYAPLHRTDSHRELAHLSSDSRSSNDELTSTEQDDLQDAIFLDDWTIVPCGQFQPFGPIAWDCYSGMRTDPFGYIKTRSSDTIDYFAQLMAPSHAPVYKIFDVSNIFSHFLFELLQHDDYFYAATASTLVAMESSWRTGQTLPAKVFEYLKIAISRLRQRLGRSNGEADVVTIMAVQALAITAGATGDLVNHELHKRTLVPLVNCCGGIDALGYDGHPKTLLMQWEACWALYTGTAMFPTARPTHVPYYPPFPFEPKVRALVLKLPLGFDALAQRRILSLSTLEVLARTADASDQQLRDGSIIADEREYFCGTLRRYSDFWEACPCLSVPDSQEAQPNLEKIVVLALILYCRQTFNSVQSMSATYAGVRLNLASNLVRRWGAADASEVDAMVWVWMIVVDVWTNIDGTLLPRGLKLLHLMKKRFRSVHTTNQMLMRLRLFFCNEKFEQRCRAYWNSCKELDGNH